MTRSHKVLGFLLVAILGIYGCARTPTAGPDRTAEAKIQRLEEDFRAAAAARDQFRQRLAQAEERQADLQRQLDGATATAAAEKRAKDTLRAERDALQTQYDGFRRTIRDLLGQADAAMASPSGPPPAFVGGAALTSPTAVRN